MKNLKKGEFMMRKKCLSFALLLAFLMTGLLGTNAMSFNSEKGIISVNTSSNMEVIPDVAEISFAVQTSHKESMQIAALENKKISDEVFSKLKTYINEQNGDYIKTSDFKANPVYSYQNSKKIFERYEVSNKVIVHTKSIDEVGQMVDKALTLGATNVENLSFSVSNYESQCNELISEASKKAKTRADLIAKSLSTSIKGISNLTSSCSANEYNTPRLYLAKNMISDVAAESTSSGVSISNGVIKINANVNASFFAR